MLSVRDLDEFLQSFMRARDESQLLEALERVTRTLGFRQFAMGHHVDLGQPPNDAIRLSTYNADWVHHILERQYFFDDPVHSASMKTVVGFRWSDIPNIIRLTPRQKQILAEAVAFGLGEGFTVPVHLPGEYQGTCSFGAPSLERLKGNALPIAQLCGSFAFEAARRIIRRNSGINLQPPPVLTPRQHEATVLIGRGKTDEEIGQLMRISRATAHEHVEGARRAYGNAQRPYLIVRALFDCQITFADLLRR
ncbi:MULTISPECIES: autoinducer binding domain-containing protein [unclassified Sphingobium]|jgi:LuxR family transcriptional regulator, quorum-sensing system regulator CciR|uniref:helix-turn-helix transcriptional regulator n=1 Tax=unclassified Sphingobium TaxID=2611147 RepID=UPI0035A5B53B